MNLEEEPIHKSAPLSKEEITDMLKPIEYNPKPSNPPNPSRSHYIL